MIVVVGLAFEARIAARSGLHVICAAGNRDFAATLHEAINNDCKGLISFGVAGGLSPDLRPGACVVASSVVHGDVRHSTDGEWSRTLLRGIPGSMSGVIAGASEPIVTPAEKRALHLSSGAVAVDMESHVVARVAKSHRLPMVAIRVVCDPAARRLPEAAFRSIRSDGTTDLRILARSLFWRPNHVPAFLQIAADATAARAVLSRCCRVLGPGLGLTERLELAH